MLKITVDRDLRRFVLEGSLAGRWVGTLQDCWRLAPAAHGAHETTVDLSEVTYIDGRGKKLLAMMHEAGVTLTASDGMNRELIREIANDSLRTAAGGRSIRASMWLVTLILPSVVWLGACSNIRAREPAQTDDRPSGNGRPSVAVEVAPVVSAHLTDVVEVVGSLAPKFAADVKSEVSGTVAAVYVTEWVPVRAGARLAQLDVSESEAALEAIRAAEAQARVAEARAQREYNRAVELKHYGLITVQARDDARSALEAAEAATASARAQVRAAEARLAKSSITAPMDGTIAMRGVNVGDRVENIGSGVPMFRIVDNRLLNLTVSVPSVYLGAVHVDQTLEFTVDAVPQRTFEGRVMYINPVIDVAGRAARVVAEVDNPDGVLKGGLFVRGRILVSTRDEVLQVPQAALLNWDVVTGHAEVFVVHDAAIEVRDVKTSSAAGPMVAIEAGLANGEKVVTRGKFAVKAGDRVTVAKEGA